ncbi:hypothetical protein ACC848_40095, partial [Rhizobium johnstonii]
MAGEQTVWTVDGPPAVITRAPAPELIRGTHNIGVRGDGFSTLFSTLYGGLASYRFGQSVDGGRELLASMPKPN